MEGNVDRKNSDIQDNDKPCPEVDNRSWYVIHTCSRQEAKVESTLLRKNIETFLPKVTVPSRRRDRKLLLNVPLFPGYLFVHTDLNDWAYAKILGNRGVVRILGSKGQYTALPVGTVASIKTLLNSGQPIFPWAQLTPGKQVRVVDGPLAGAKGVILRHKPGKRRLVVGVELLGRSICAELAEETVEADR
jgi:transcriptional antiterminator NusG